MSISMSRFYYLTASGLSFNSSSYVSLGGTFFSFSASFSSRITAGGLVDFNYLGSLFLSDSSEEIFGGSLAKIACLIYFCSLMVSNFAAGFLDFSARLGDSLDFLTFGAAIVTGLSFIYLAYKVSNY